jgi:D-alanine-D-alanine ligase
MNVGITFDLREEYLARGFGEEETAEFDSPVTIAAIETALQEMGFVTERIGSLPSLVERLASGASWDLVFNIAEGLHGFAREAQIPALLEGYGINCTFSDAMVLSMALHKGMTKRVLRDLGLPTPDFAVVESEGDLAEVHLDYPLFAKPVAEGTSKGITSSSIIEGPALLRPVCLDLLSRFRQPVLLEQFLPGREFTVGIVGTGPRARVIGSMEVILGEKADQMLYSYDNKEEYEDRVSYRLVRDPAGEPVERIALAAWRGLGCRDGGRVDLRMDEKGIPHVLEINPLPGLNPERSDLPILCRMAHIPYQELIAGIVRSALSRQPQGAALPRPRPSPGIHPVLGRHV